MHQPSKIELSRALWFRRVAAPLRDILALAGLFASAAVLLHLAA